MGLFGRKTRAVKGTKSPIPPEQVVYDGPDGPTVLSGTILLEKRATFAEGLVVKGTLELGDETVLRGPVTVEGDLTLGRGSRLPDVATVHGNLHLKSGAVVKGAEVGGDAFVASGARVDGDLTCRRLLLPAKGG
ncbi:MAG TPA: polymer-forming cytoskeletal protein [Candidatus Thermoplasmatota archaeon]|nr:polymer-forming cytoskeletal protein [Candidatus Thermoplasmatota archaeon]